jgi:hypothetical protein
MQTASIDNSDLGSINLERHPTGKVVDTAQCLDCFRDVFLDERNPTPGKIFPRVNLASHEHPFFGENRMLSGCHLSGLSLRRCSNRLGATGNGAPADSSGTGVIPRAIGVHC